MEERMLNLCVDGKVIATVKESQLNIEVTDIPLEDGFVRPKGTGWENINGVWKNTIKGLFLVVPNSDMEFKVTLAMSGGKAYVDHAFYKDYEMTEWEEVPEKFHTTLFMEWSGPYFKQLKEMLS